MPWMCPRAARSCALRASASRNVLSMATRTVPASSRRPSSASCRPFERTWVIETVTPSLAASSVVGEAREHREQGAATPERAQEATGGGTAQRVEDEVDVVRDVLGRGPGVVDDLVGAELAQERFLRARCHGDDPRTPPFRQLDREVPDAARGTVDEHRRCRRAARDDAAPAERGSVRRDRARSGTATR